MQQRRGVIADDGRSIGQLVESLAESTAGLIRDEVALALREIADGLHGMRRGLILLVVAAVLALTGLFSLTLAMMYGLASYTGYWQAALVVAVALLLAAGIAAAAGLKPLGFRQLRPRQTLETLQETKQWLRQSK